MAPSRESWADGFISQSRSDWQVFQKLSRDSDLPKCHQLHYLQMACEKVAKAYRLRDLDTNEADSRKQHVAFSKFIGPFLLSPSLKADYNGREEQLQALVRNSKLLAREIEKLAPAVDKDSSPQNAEYPWDEGDDIVVPRDYSFPNLSLLHEAGGRAFLKLITRAIDEFEDVRIR